VPIAGETPALPAQYGTDRVFVHVTVRGAAPDRAIWCTDWPHVQYRKPMPKREAK
jgi:predicted TIM-barrel fold metal-dependent hydrolase